MTEETSTKRGPGRPRKHAQVMKTYSFRITPSELDRTRLAAALIDMDVSDYVNLLIRQGNNAHLPADQ